MLMCIGNILAGSFVVFISTQVGNFVSKNNKNRNNETNGIKSNISNDNDKILDKDKVKGNSNEYVVYEPEIVIKNKKEISGQAYLKLVLW